MMDSNGLVMWSNYMMCWLMNRVVSDCNWIMDHTSVMRSSCTYDWLVEDSVSHSWMYKLMMAIDM